MNCQSKVAKVLGKIFIHVVCITGMYHVKIRIVSRDKSQNESMQCELCLGKKH